ncbi:hypothetical protein K432DRAFT_65944 [Lepidopterella palustris CBS 459.81]|uniref:Nudix hydrolase domain-containing protein n=1 Tax=Lepidopterella palustris CBS 459.81 TaxID=1314670 RepID=A0A8E2ELS8_9PEZI|nr:hypothetical protein K432DRAFT_65944 [Lepidopterella palustris CBS 459.81]
MATEQYATPDFVESCGLIPIDVRNRRVCLVYLKRKEEYVLAKGRRNILESRSSAAIREIFEETGLSCSLLPVRMETRAPPQVELAPTRDVVRVEESCVEPFMVTIREMKAGHVKIIWWFVGNIEAGQVEALEEGRLKGGEEQFKAQMFGVDDAVRMLEFQSDRGVLEKALELVRGTYWGE